MDTDFWNETYLQDPAQPAVKDYFVEEEVNKLSPGSALDLGCGTGNLLIKLAAKGWVVTGVDIAEEAIRLANEAAKQCGLAATFVTGSSLTWHPPQQVDLVFSTFAMPEGEDMKTAVSTMIAALKPGGTLILCEWDQKMAAVWGFGADDLHTIDAYLAAMPGLDIEAAETRFVENAFDSDFVRGGSTAGAYITFIRATKTGPI